MKKINLLFSIIFLITLISNNKLSAQCTDGDIILNGSFETGDFTNWVVMDLASPFFPQGVICNGPLDVGFGFDPINPLDGNCLAGNGFDGAGPGQITHHQEITIPANSTATLNFSFAVAYFIVDGSLERMFEVQIQPVGGGTPIDIPFSYSAPPGTETGTGWMPITLDLSAFAGQTVWLCFVETIPESFTGPAQLGLDGISLDIVCLVCDDPCANNTDGALPCTYDEGYNECDDGCEFTVDTFNDTTCECELVLTIPNCDDDNPDTTDSYDEDSCACVNTFVGGDVPTVGEWGLIILAMLMLIIAVIGIRQKTLAPETH